MRILFNGDSITDMDRNRECDLAYNSNGYNYTFFINGELSVRFPKRYSVYTRGIGGNGIVDLYTRVKRDAINVKPDVLSLLIGINDVWREITAEDGLDVAHYEKISRMYLDDVKNALPQIKFVLLEPFVLKGAATEKDFGRFSGIKEYAKVVRELAEEYGATFVPLQEILDEKAERYGAEYWLYDGVHPSVAGAKLIADEWLKAAEKAGIITP